MAQTQRTSNHSAKQKRQAHHVMASEKKQGRSSKDAERIGYATANKQRGGGHGSSSRSSSSRSSSHRKTMH